MYAKMPFGLMNVGATFQRAMDIAFIGEKDKFVVIYLDDITVFSKTDQEHCYHLKKVFHEVSKVWPIFEPQEIIVRYARGGNY
jgi:hypothetical protein